MKQGASEPSAAERQGWPRSSTSSPVVEAEAPAPPKAPEVRSIDVERAQLVGFALVLLAAGLAHVHPGLALIAPALYLLVVSYPRRR